MAELDTDELLDEQSRGWAGGKRPQIESWLQQYPELRQTSDTLLDLIYNEVLCRVEIGEQPGVEEYVLRFPELSDAIRRQFEVHQAMTPDGNQKGSEPQSPPLELRAGRYHTTAFHAAGGLGLVYRATDRELDRVVALKCLKQAASSDSAIGRRFFQEAEITSRLEHPSIVPIHGRGKTDDGRPFYAMRFVEGETLESASRRLHAAALSPQDRNVEFRRLLRAFVGVCEAVAYAHSRQIVHRDLKPSNIMLGPYGESLVLDWGLAQYFQQHEITGQIAETDSNSDEGQSGQTSLETPHGELTVEGHAKGSPAFMSPEQARGDWSQVGPASDVFSLGSTLYYLLIGRVAFAGSTAKEVIEQVQSGGQASPKSVDPTLPAPLNAICQRAMSPAPAERYPSAKALAEDIDRWLADEPVTAWSEPPVVRLRRWAKRHRTLVATSLATLLVALVALSIGSWRLNRFNLRLAEANQRETDLRTRAETGEKEAQAQSALATKRFHEALEANVVLVKDIQEQLSNTPGTRKIRENLIRAAMKRLEQMVASEEQAPDIDQTVAQAHDSLGELYRDMDGDTTKSLEEFRLACQIARECKRKNPDDPATSKLFFSMLMDLVHDETRVGHFDLALAALDEAETQIVPGSEFELVDRAILLSARGFRFQALGDGPNAINAYSASSEFWKQLAETSEGGDASRNHALVLNSLVNVLLEEGRYESALETCAAEQAIWEALLATNPGIMEFENQLANLLQKKGHCLLKMEKQEHAKKSYQTSLELSVKIADRDPENMTFQTNLGNAHAGMAAVFYETGDMPQSNRHLALSREVYEKIVAIDPGNLAAQTNLSRSLQREAINLSVQQRHNEANNKFEESIKVCREILAVAPQRTVSRVDLAGLLGDFGVRRIRNANDLEKGFRTLDESRQEWEILVATDPDNLLWQSRLINAWYLIAKWRDIHSLPECEAAIRSGLEAIARIDPIGQGHPMILDTTGDLRRLSAIQCLNQNRADEGIEILNSEVKKLETTAQDLPAEPFVWNDLMTCQLLLADEYKKREDLSRRISHLTSAAEAGRTGDRLFPHLGRDSTALPDLLEELAEILVQTDPVESLGLFSEAINCFERITPEILATPKYQESLIIKNLKLGDLYVSLLSDAEGALKCYLDALRCCQRIGEDSGPFFSNAQAFKALCHCKVGDLQLTRVEFDAAKSSYEKAEAILTERQSQGIGDIPVGAMALQLVQDREPLLNDLPDCISSLDSVGQLPENARPNAMDVRFWWLLSKQQHADAFATVTAIADSASEDGVAKAGAALLLTFLAEKNPAEAEVYRQRALALLKAAVEEGYFGFEMNAFMVRANPRFKNLADRPEFQALFEENPGK